MCGQQLQQQLLSAHCCGAVTAYISSNGFSIKECCCISFKLNCQIIYLQQFIAKEIQYVQAMSVTNVVDN